MSHALSARLRPLLVALVYAALLSPSGCKDEAKSDDKKSEATKTSESKGEDKADDDEAKSKKKKKKGDEKAAGCQADADCKGARICQDGKCVDPPEPKAKPKDDDEKAEKPEPPKDEAPKKAGPRLLVQSEKDELHKILAKFDVDDKQSFKLDLNGFGSVYFASTIYKENSEPGFLIVQGGKVVYVMPKLEDTEGWMRDSVKGVWFGPIDADGDDDVIVIADYMTGMGKMGAVPFPVVGIFMSSGAKSFKYDATKSKGANDKQLKDIPSVRKYLGLK